MFLNTTVAKDGLTKCMAFPSEVCVGYKGKTYFIVNQNLWEKGNIPEMWKEFTDWLSASKRITRIEITDDFGCRVSAKILGANIDHHHIAVFSSTIAVDNIVFQSSTVDGQRPIFFEAIITNPSADQIQKILAFNPELCHDLPTFRCEVAM